MFNASNNHFELQEIIRRQPTRISSNPFDKLPDELILEIIRWLDLDSLFNFFNSCKKMSTLAETRQLRWPNLWFFSEIQAVFLTNTPLRDELKKYLLKNPEKLLTLLNHVFDNPDGHRAILYFLSGLAEIDIPPYLAFRYPQLRAGTNSFTDQQMQLYLEELPDKQNRKLCTLLSHLYIFIAEKIPDRGSIDATNSDIIRNKPKNVYGAIPSVASDACKFLAFILAMLVGVILIVLGSKQIISCKDYCVIGALLASPLLCIMLAIFMTLSCLKKDYKKEWQRQLQLFEYFCNVLELNKTNKKIQSSHNDDEPLIVEIV